MADHGRLFDNFNRQASHGHGGSYFDSGFTQAELQEAHGKLFDLFGAPREGAQGHGARWDEFGWQEMPTIHGHQFDTDFQAPQAGEGHEHGSTWFDVFRGGTQARYMFDGRDYEGTVIECRSDHALLRTRGGETHEVGLGQFLAYRTPNEQQAAPSLPESDAEAPSAHDATAHGNFGTTGTPAPTAMPSVTEHVSPGPGNAGRHEGVPDGIMDTFTRLRKAIEDPELTVQKDVDVTETAAQGASVKTVGHRNNCPRGGSAPCGAEADGRCSLCRAEVHDHDAVGKSDTGDLGIEVPERPHKASDHHTTGRKPGTCPHCGGVLDELDEKASQGQPSRAHKCVGTGLDVLKAL